MINQISSQSPKLPFFYRHLPILLGVIIVIIIAGGILGWQYWLAPKEEKEALRDVQTTEELETERAEVLEREFPMEEAIKEEVVPAEEEFKVLPEEEILEEKIPPQIEYTKERLPRFEDFPILERFEGMPAQVDLLSHPKAMEFRTRLIEGAKKRTKFCWSLHGCHMGMRYKLHGGSNSRC